MQIVLTLVTIQVLMTVIRRKEKLIYVTLWYLTAAYVWTTFNYAFGHFILPYSFPGINNAAMHGLYIHYVVGLWITPAGLAVIYYFLPLAAQRPLYSHRLSLIGFWSLAFFYPFVGTHHYIYSPIPVLDADHRDRRLHDADHSGLDGDPELLRHHGGQLAALPGVVHREVPDPRARSTTCSGASRARPRRCAACSA